MTEPTQQSPNKEGTLVRVLSIARWVSAAVLLFVIGFYFVGPLVLPHTPTDEYGRAFIVPIDQDREAIAHRRIVVENAPQPELYASPVAAHMVAMGHQLIEEPRQRLIVARELEELSQNPALIGDDMEAYLAISTAYWQLRHDPDVSGSLEAAQLIWHTANRVEALGHIRSAENVSVQAAP